MKLSCLSLISVLFASLSGCSSYAIEGRYSNLSDINYSDIKSFLLLPVDDSDFSTPQSTAHYRKAMVDALTAKGFTENPENPDWE